jgi:hypothetical protein
VLVVFLPGPQDMDIARLLGWYRIPLRTAPKVVAVDWLAFYSRPVLAKNINGGSSGLRRCSGTN